MSHLPDSVDLYASGGAAGTLLAVSFVDADLFFAAAGATANVAVFLYADVVFAEAVCFGELGVAGFVTFPSDARRGEADFTLYLDFVCFCCDSVAPIRGREDTEGNRNASVKVQGAWSRGVPS